MSDELDAIVTGVLSRPLGEIVGARDQAVRALRSDRRTAEAAELARLRRPSPPLWAANRLHDLDGGVLRELLDAGTDVRAAQAALLAGEQDAVERLATAGRRFNSAVGAATRSAFDLLLAEGHGAGADTERRLQSMLRAAAVADDATRTAILEGRLLSEPQPAGFDVLQGVPLQAPAGDAGERRERDRELHRAVGERRHAHEAAEREAAARRARAAELAREFANLQRRAGALQRELEAQREAVSAAEAVAREALAALDRASAAVEG